MFLILSILIFSNRIHVFLSKHLPSEPKLILSSQYYILCIASCDYRTSPTEAVPIFSNRIHLYLWNRLPSKSKLNIQYYVLNIVQYFKYNCLQELSGIFCLPIEVQGGSIIMHRGVNIAIREYIARHFPLAILMKSPILLVGEAWSVMNESSTLHVRAIFFLFSREGLLPPT